MPNSQPTRRRRAALAPLPARCLRCDLAAFMEVQFVQVGPKSYEWQVNCWQCSAWRPGYPLITPRKE